MVFYYFYQAAMIFSLLVSAFILVLIWPRRQLPGAWAMMALAISTFICTFGWFLETHSLTLERQLFFNNIGYVGSMSVPVAWFVFTLHYTSGRKLLSSWRILPLCIVPIVIIALVWSNNWHHLMWSNEHLVTSGVFTVTAKTYGPFFWVAITYSYILIIIGSIMLVRRLFVGLPLYIGQVISFIIAASLPFIWSIISIFKFVLLPRVELTPVMFAVSGLAITIGLMRFKLFTLVPFARKFLFEQLNDCIMFFDIRRQLLEANPAALVVLGMDKTCIGKRMEDLSLLTPVLEQISSGHFSRPELLLTVSGNERFFENETLPMRDNQNQLLGWLVILRDIDERKKAEEALKASEAQLKAVFDSITDGIAITTNGDKILLANDAFVRMLGYADRSELVGESASTLVNVSQREQIMHYFTGLVQDSNRSELVRCNVARKDGTEFPVELSSAIIPNLFGTRSYVTVVRDITERLKMQENLLITDRLVSIGELASGVAHEINNPLTSIMGFSEMILKQELPVEIKPNLEIINSEARRVARIVKNLLIFARKHEMTKQPVNVNTIIEQTLELRAYEQKVNNIVVETLFDDNLPEIMGDFFQLQQVFLNIIVNAEYFMQEAHHRGRMVIQTLNLGDVVRVSLADDGPGIAPENITHIFAPFFTTKPVGRGTGLGLSICHGIVSEHGGDIRVESKSGKGATFIVELPVSSLPENAAK